MKVYTTGRLVNWIVSQARIGFGTNIRPVYQTVAPDGKECKFVAIGKPGFGISWGLSPLNAEKGVLEPLDSEHPLIILVPSVYGGPRDRWEFSGQAFEIAIEWQSKKEAAYTATALALAGRCHLPKWQRDKTPPAENWEEVAKQAAAKAGDGWVPTDFWSEIPFEHPANPDEICAKRNKAIEQDKKREMEKEAVKALRNRYLACGQWRTEVVRPTVPYKTVATIRAATLVELWAKVKKYAKTVTYV